MSWQTYTRGIVSTVLLVAVAMGCSNGQSDSAPEAQITVIGAGFEDTARSGSLIILSGKESEGFDAPILDYEFTAQDPSVVLEERTSNSVAFRAPEVANDTDFDVTLTVRDPSGRAARTTKTIRVLAIGDLDKFLAVGDGPRLGQLGSGQTDLDQFELVVSPTGIPSDTTFGVRMRAYLQYPDRSAACVSTLPRGQCEEWDPNQLLPLSNDEVWSEIGTTGSTPIVFPGELSFPLDIEDISWNGTNAVILSLPIPLNNLGLINQRILESIASLTYPFGGFDSEEDARDLLLDPWRVDSSDIVFTFELFGTSTAAQIAYRGPALAGSSSPTTPISQSSETRFGQILPSAGLASIDLRESGAAVSTSGRKIESLGTANAYYAAIDPAGQFKTLEAWLEARGFSRRATPNSPLVLDPAAIEGTGEFAHAKYLNNFDLGFGRDMYTRVDESTGNVYSFVTNYPTLQSALEGFGDIVTVVMEFSPAGGDFGDPKFTKFFVYVPDDESGQQLRVASIDFDGRGQKLVPGVCVACHGGTVPAIEQALDGSGYRNANDLVSADIGSAFMPWDLESFLYSDTDPAIPAVRRTPNTRSRSDVDPTGAYTRDRQENQLRKLNIAALTTYQRSPYGSDSRFDASRELLAMWYPPGAIADDGSDACNATAPNACLVGRFQNGQVPGPWSTGTSVDDDKLYTEVYAQNCRACHTLLERSDLRFSDAASLLLDPSRTDPDPAMIDTVFRTGVMPFARLTMDRFWTGSDTHPSPASQLAVALGLPAGARPGGPIVEASAVQSCGDPGDSDPIGCSNSYFFVKSDASGAKTKIGRSVPFEVTQLAFADSVSWEFVTDEPGNGCGSTAGDVPSSLVETSATTAVFTATTPGDYCVRAVGRKGARVGESAPIAIGVKANRLPEAVVSSNAADCPGGDLCLSVSEGGGSDLGLPGERRDEGSAASAMRFVSLVDLDVEEKLDPSSVLEIDFDALPSSLGSLSLDGLPLGVDPDPISFDRFVGGIPRVRYRPDPSQDPDLGSTLDVALLFDLYDGGAFASGHSASIEITAANGNAPIFSSLPPSAVELAFSDSDNIRSTSFTFDVDDADGGAVEVSISAMEPDGSWVGEYGLGDLDEPTAQSVPATFSFNYQSAIASRPVIGEADPCTGINDPSSFSDFVRIIASDGFNLPVTSDPIELRVGPSIRWNQVRDALSVAIVADGRTCADSGCHGGSSPRPFLDPSSINVPATFSSGLASVDLVDPALSRLITRPESAGHSPGPVTDNQAWRDAREQVIRWVTECAPNAAAP